MADPIEILTPDGAWPQAFERLAAWLSSALGLAIRIEHVGSTAVPGLAAKPIIDIMVGVHDRRDLPKVARNLLALGFEPDEAAESLETSVFLHRAAGRGDPPINLHLALVDTRPWRDLLRFRDKLRSDRRLALHYEDLKRRLAVASNGDLGAYTAGKSAFVADVLGATHS